MPRSTLVSEQAIDSNSLNDFNTVRSGDFGNGGARDE